MKNPTFDSLIERAEEVRENYLTGVETLPIDKFQVAPVFNEKGKETGQVQITTKDKKVNEFAQDQLLKNIGLTMPVMNRVNSKLGLKRTQELMEEFIEASVETPDHTSISRNVTVKLDESGSEIAAIPNLRNPGFNNVDLLTSIYDELKKKKISTEISPMSYINDLDQMNLKLLLPDQIDVFKELGLSDGYKSDNYMSGIEIRNSFFNDFATNIRSFIERVICTNGMTANAFSYNSRANNNDPLMSFVYQTTRSLTDSELLIKFRLEIMEKFSEMYNTEASIHEVEKFTDIFVDSTSDDQLNQIQNHVMDINRFTNLYGEDIANKSKKWKSTANTGIKLYDLLNVSTYANTHLVKSQSHRDENNQRITEMFFKKSYDLIDVAPKLIIEEDILSDLREQFKLN
jgi:hypothetical protein